MSPHSPRSRSRLLWVIPGCIFALVAGLGVAQATIGDPMRRGQGTTSFGKTAGGGLHQSTFTYNHGYYCDTRVSSKSTSGCEAGAPATVTKPAGGPNHVDPLYITVPLGFSVPMAMDCPAGITCIDHPDTIDLTRLASALAPIFKASVADLTPALANFRTPGHDHFISVPGDPKPEWWNVEVIGVADPAVYKAIQAKGTLAYIRTLQKAKNPAVTPDIPTNLFLYFSAS